MTAAKLLKSCSAIALAVGASMTVLPTSAAAQTWTGAFDDDYADGRNWSGGVAPTANGNADIDTTTNAPVVDTGDSALANQLRVGPRTAGTLIVQGGGMLRANGINIGGSASLGTAGDGMLFVRGTGTRVTVAGGIAVATTANSRGVLTIESGAQMSASNADFGIVAGSVANVTVRNAGSVLDLGTGPLIMGRRGAPGVYDARLSILDGGQVLAGGIFGSALEAGTTLIVSGSDSLLAMSSGLLLASVTARIAEGGTLRTAALTTTGNTQLTLDRGTLGAAGQISMNDTGRIDAVNSRIEVGSTMTLSNSSSLTISGTDSALSAGRVVLTGNSVLNIGAADGGAAAAIGVADQAFSADSLSFDNGINSSLVINHTGRLILRSQLQAGSGSSGIVHRAGTTILNTTDGGFRGRFDLTGGTVFLDGLLSTDRLQVSGGAVLAGTGRLDRTATILDGIVRPGGEGAGVGILSLGALVLSPTSILDLQLGAPNAAAGAGSDLLRVSATNSAGTFTSTGNLTLDGTLNVTDAGGFGAGLYRLIDYSGALTNNGLAIGTVPTGFAAGDLTVQTSVAQQINLLVGSPISATFWDGADTSGNGVIDGSTGIWTTTATNWTIADGTRNGAYDPTKLLIFAGTGGTVTVDNTPGAVTSSGGLQFASNGYRVEGGAIGFGGLPTTIRVGDGTAAGSAITATLASQFTGATNLVKTGLGTLALTGASTIATGVDVRSGTLLVEAAGTVSSGEVKLGAFGPATLTIRNGGSLTAVSTTVGGSLDGGSNADADGTLLIAGAGTQVSAGRLLAAFGDGSVGTISVTGGGVLNSASGEIGNRASTGMVTVSGAGSQWNSAGLRLGTGTANDSRGSLTILDGGVLTLAANSVLQVSDGSDLRVSGAGARIDGATTSRLELERSTTGGTVVLENGGVASVGSAEFGNDSALTITGGARLDVAGGPTSFNENARVLVTGAGSMLTSGGNFNFIANGVGADVVFDDGAIVTSTANVGSSLAFRGSRRLIVRNGAEFNLTGGTAASLTLDGGTLDVTDASVSLSGDLLFSDTSAISTARLRNSNFSANNVALLGANARLIVGAEAGQAAGTVGSIDFGDQLTITQPSAALVLNYTGPGLTIDTRFGGTGGRFTHLAGETRLTGFSNQWRGITDLTGGSLAVDNLFGDSTGPTTAMNVSGDAILSGQGTIGGVVSVANGTIAPGGIPLSEPENDDRLTRAALAVFAAAPGDPVGVLTIGGPLALSAESTLAYQLGVPDGVAGVASDLLNVGGNLTLDGTLDVTDVGGFGTGVYRLINYGGGLTDNGLTVGATPTGFAAGSLIVQTAVAQQVNLIVGASLAPAANFWDGANTTDNDLVDGGTGTWTTVRTNWTLSDGASNGAYDPAQFLIFAGTGGTVTVDNTAAPVTIGNGIQFASNGYALTGGGLSLTGTNTLVRVGDGTSAGAAITANVSSALTGAGDLTKTDLGTVVLTGASTLGGIVDVQAGTLRIDGGAMVQATGLRVAPVSTAARLVVTGEGATLDFGGDPFISGSAAGLAAATDIMDGGTLRGGDGTGDAYLWQPGTAVTVSGATSLLAINDDIDFRGSLLIDDNGRAGLGSVNFNGATAVTSAISLTVRGGGQLESDDLSLNSFVPGLVEGSGSLVTVNGRLFASSGSALTIRDGAVIAVNGDATSAFGGTGDQQTTDILNGALLRFNGADADLSLDASTVTVDGSTLGVGDQVLIGDGRGNASLLLRNSDFSARGLRVLSADNVISIGGRTGDQAGGAGSFDVSNVTLDLGATMVLNHNSAGFTVRSEFLGSGTINHIAGDTRLTGTSETFSGLTALTGGHLRIDGVHGGTASTVMISGGATLSGSGRIGGAVNVGAGTVAAGGQPVQSGEGTFGRSVAPPDDAVGLLTIDGALTLTANSFLLYQLGAPEGASGIDSDLINVGGTLMLDGTLDVVDIGGFGEGVYRLINYGGALTDNGLDIGLTPTGFAGTELAIQTSVAQQVNLIVAVAPPVPNSFTFWDGPNLSANAVVDGGSGLWTSAGTNWTIADGSTNGVYDRSALLIFAGTGGVVTVDNTDSPVSLENGVQFAADGYAVGGGNIVLDDDSVDQVTVRVGDGTQAGAAFTATIGSALTGGAGLRKTDLGTLVLTGGNSYTGGTNIVDGTIRGTATSIQGDVRLEDQGTLVFDQASDGVFAGILSGSGVVRTRGAGVLEITGASNAFAGMTTVETGALRLTGALGGLTTVGSAGTLTGNGTLAQLDVSGRVSPGGAGVATLTVDDLNTNQETRLSAANSFAREIGAAAIATSPDIVFRAGSVFAVDLAASGAGDRINATGTATLEGGTVAITTLDADLAYADGAIFRILNAEGGLTGTFAGLTESSAFLDFALGYDPTGAFLTLSQVRMFPDVALTINQKAAASALGTLVRPVGSDGLAVYNAVLGLDENAARAAFDASSGEIYASLLAVRQRQGFALTSRFTSRAQADFAEGLGVWGGITGHGGRIDADSDRNAGRVSSDGIGGELGLDYRGNDNGWAVGFGGGWQDGNIDLPVRASYAKHKTWHIGGYLRLGTGGPGFTGLATVVHATADTDVTRSIAFSTIARSASANTDISTTAVSVDARYGWGLGNWSLGPAATAGRATSRFSAFSETGAQALNLSGTGSRDTSTRYGIGGFTRYSGANGYLDLTAYYVPGDRDDARATLSMAGSPQTFTVLAPRGSKSSVRVSASSQYNMTERLSLGGNIGVDHGSEERDVYGSLRVSYRF